MRTASFASISLPLKSETKIVRFAMTGSSLGV